MSQLNFYVPEDIEERIKNAAKAEGKSVSAYLAELVKAKFSPKKWDDNFFTAVLGQWAGDFPNVKRNSPQERDDF